MKLIQDNGQPNFGRFLQAPTAFNIQDYRNPFLTANWQRKLRYKKFGFMAVQHKLKSKFPIKIKYYVSYV